MKCLRKCCSFIDSLSDAVVSDLSRLVEKQGGAIDEIAANTSETHAKTETGLEQLHQAEKLQRSGNNCVIC